MARKDIPAGQGFPLESALLLGARAARQFADIEPHRWIRALRERLGMTQAELAGKTGLTQADLSRIENGLLDPRLSLLKRLFEALHCRAIILPHASMEYDSRVAGEAEEPAESENPRPNPYWIPPSKAWW